MSTPFKMKGSPMQRNFGIGTSPVKQDVKRKKIIPGKKVEEKYDMHIRTTPGGKRDTIYVKPETITREQFGMSSKRYKRLQENREFNEYAEKQGWKPSRPKYGDKEGLKNYEKFYSNKANIGMLNKKQKEYFKKTGGWDGKERLIK